MVFVFAALFVIATYIAVRIPHRYGRRDVIVRALEREISRGLSNKGRLNEHSLEDLIDLGRQSESGQDKELVLQALYRLVVKTCDNDKYTGDALETLIQSLVNILASNSVPGTPQNFFTAMEILHRIVTTTDRANSATMSLVDVLWAVHELSALGQAVLLHVGPKEIEHTMMRCIQALGVMANRHAETVTEVSQALFEVGVVAIEKNQMLIAIAALDKLITLAQMCQPARNELAADMLGLVAHFWIASYTAHNYVRSQLAEICDALAEPLPRALEMASRHCVATIQFQTSDNLNNMIHDLQQNYASTAWPTYTPRGYGKRSSRGTSSRFGMSKPYQRRV